METFVFFYYFFLGTGANQEKHGIPKVLRGHIPYHQALGGIKVLFFVCCLGFHPPPSLNQT